MESDNQRQNPRPTANTSLPLITLGVLVAIIIALLYIGKEYIADNTNGSDELTHVKLDTNQRALALSEPENILPDEPDTANAPLPVDLSQDDVATDNGSASQDVATDAGGSKKTPVEIAASETPRPAETPAPAKQTKAKPEVTEKKPETVKPVSGGKTTTTHTVEVGETLYSIANRYNLKINTLKELNPGLSESSIKSGVTKLTVKVRAIHTVGPGDILRVVAEKYGVTVEALMRANHKTKNMANRGERLFIPMAEKE